MKLTFGGAPELSGLLLKGAERAELARAGHEVFHNGRSEGTDQLVLEIGVAHEEAE